MPDTVVGGAAEAGDDALASLLGRCRAQVLRELDRPGATLDLARRMGSARPASGTT